MGAWGTGIYDNDTAADWGAETSRSLLEEARSMLERDDLSLMELDLALPALDVTCYICETADCNPLYDYNISQWRTRVLELLDRNWKAYHYSEESYRERSRVIADLFDRLERLASDSSEP